jgi:tRNA(Ile)-lysidine synthase TilS/MesJ
LEASGCAYSIEPMQLAADEALPMGCQRCAWNRRRVLFNAAQRLGCQVVAFGHHADDLAQTTLLNLLFHGKVETMAPRRDFFDGSLRVVRPLCYLAEKDLRRFARANQFPLPPPACPVSHRSRRELTRELLAQVGRACTDGGVMARANLLRAGLAGLEAVDEPEGPDGKQTG